jgi:HK97 gp10 family phage protein
MRIDNSDLTRLALDLQRAATNSEDTVEKRVKTTANYIKRDWKDNARAASQRHGKHFPNSITVEKTGKTEAEIGPERGRTQGFLGAILEYGAVYSAPHNLMKDAADKNEKEFSDKVLRDVHLALRRLIG